MKLMQAIEQVFAEAALPRQYPEDWRPMSAGDLQADKPVAQEAQHESLTEAQEAVCRWVWEKCGRHLGQAWEQWESGFLFDASPSRELAVWARIAVAFQGFMRRHPSHEPHPVIQQLVAISSGIAGKFLAARRAHELRQLWESPEPPE